MEYVCDFWTLKAIHGPQVKNHHIKGSKNFLSIRGSGIFILLDLNRGFLLLGYFCVCAIKCYLMWNLDMSSHHPETDDWSIQNIRHTLTGSDFPRISAEGFFQHTKESFN